MILIKKGFLVEGEDPINDTSLEAIEAWKEKTPSFQSWDQEWFQKEIVSTGDFIADDSDSYCGGGSILLFATKEAAEKYGARDAAIASGVREITPCFYVNLKENFGLTDFENGQDGIIAVFYEKNIIMFEDSSQGLELAQILTNQIMAELSES